MGRLDPLNCIAWGSIGLGIILFWVWLALPLLPPSAEALQAAWEAVEAAGTLNGCKTLSLLPGECVAWAQEAR
ncbi:hypothetical protein [Paracoccus benzoatiresistens]|uniref:Uncharacterized protein n=1 Tax=Paracoccus benzoatiresistens TaxID=2997341 RepID=A0ABT4J8F0_9RHOB|nr:hypothetical protein [Paracoccus sp. EF6]MCZ0962862.1 hypothetical protein [Paracoccus sp. EF6]